MEGFSKQQLLQQVLNYDVAPLKIIYWSLDYYSEEKSLFKLKMSLFSGKASRKDQEYN